jgi:hypothetical protein
MSKTQNKNEFLLETKLTCMFETRDSYEGILSKFDTNSIIDASIEFILADGSIFKAKIVDVIKTKILEYISYDEK